MPKKHNPARNTNARLASLPRRANLVIEGGIRTLGLYLREGKEVFQPQLVIWLESESGMIRNSEILPPTKDQDDIARLALDTLVSALAQPTPVTVMSESAAPQRRERDRQVEKRMFPACLPGKIIINDAALAEAAKAVFEPLEVSIEYKEDIPLFNSAFQSLSEHLGADEEAGPPEPFEWDIPFAVVSPLFAAAAACWRRAPWDYLPDYPPIELKLGEYGPQPGVETLYASILGGLGMLPGVAFYYSLESLERFMRKSSEMMPPADDRTIDEAIKMLRQAGVPVDQLPPDEVRQALGQILGGTDLPEGEEKWELVEDGLACLFTPKDDCDPTYLEWMEAHRLKSPSREGVPNFLKTLAGQEPMNPGEREAKAMTLALEALNQFFSHFHATLQEPLTPGVPLTYQARLSGGTVVDVSYTPQEMEEDEEMFDEDDEGDEE
jgi:hypothetical protein